MNMNFKFQEIGRVVLVIFFIELRTVLSSSKIRYFRQKYFPWLPTYVPIYNQRNLHEIKNIF